VRWIAATLEGCDTHDEAKFDPVAAGATEPPEPAMFDEPHAGSISPLRAASAQANARFMGTC
jgi:hypothetical protein